ncbi:hypothetical protein GBAR_LOCUS23625 [Geodia barretti]|uniref:Uncharacterized protein n=1 Tax=Geodia barretti TaxID=519541 RepID=A0AA35T942_GEOBA|nr:hypothetical protein GBAR_LOCUS23625 [Geodia barretti]
MSKGESLFQKHHRLATVRECLLMYEFHNQTKLTNAKMLRAVNILHRVRIQLHRSDGYENVLIQFRNTVTAD